MKLFWNPLPGICFAVLAGALFTFSLLKPMADWDIIPYIASAKTIEDHDFNRVHAFTLDQIRSSFSENDFTFMTFPSYADGEHEHFRRVASNDPKVLKELLPFYQIRPVYIGLIFLLYKMGFKITTGIYLISGFSVVAGLLFLFLICREHLSRPFMFLIPPLTLLFGIADLARMPSPDAMASCSILAAFYFLHRKNVFILSAILITMIGIRTDLVFFAVPLQLILLGVSTKKLYVMISLVCSVIVYLLIVQHWHYPGWARIFSFTLIKITTDPLSSPHTVSFKDYGMVFIRESVGLLKNKSFIFYAIVSGCLAARLFNRQSLKSTLAGAASPTVVMAVTSFVYIALHFLLFPVMWDRFFTAAYLSGTVALFSVLSGKPGGTDQQQH